MTARLLIPIVALLALAGPAAAQQYDCPKGRCPLVPAVVVPAAAPVVTDAVPSVLVGHVEGDPAEVWRFFVDGRWIGSFDELQCRFTAANGDRYRFNLPPEPVERGQLPDVPTGGIDPEKIAPTGGGFSIGGRPCDKQTAFESLTAGTLVDDSKSLRLTIIGGDADRKRVREDLKQHFALTGIAADLVVNDFPPDAWQVKGLGFVTTGSPTIYVQTPAGQVVHRQDEYDGPEPLAGAIRKAKEYDPKRDRDLRKADPVKPVEPPPAKPSDPTPTPAPSPAAPTGNLGFWIMVAVLGGMLFLRRPATAA